MYSAARAVLRWWRVRPRVVVYVAGFGLALWLTSMVTINRAITRTGINRVVSSPSFWDEEENTKAHAHGYSRKRQNPDDDLAAQIAEIARSLHRAKAHARGTKTSDELRHTIGVLDKVLGSFGLDKRRLVHRPVHKPSSVCPEKYMGSTYGYPFFYKGFETTDCQYSKPLSDLVTIIAYIKDSDPAIVKNRVQTFVRSALEKNNITIVLVTSPYFKSETDFPSRVNILSFKETLTDGAAWNKLVSEVETPYVFVARDAELITEDARLERLVREIEMLQVPVAAGAVRYPDGHWKKGCYQSVHRNFTLRYLEGYDESIHECLFCDYVLGPFVTSKETLKSFPFRESDMGNGLFHDWFLTLTKADIEIIACPDSMFHIRHDKTDINWQPFMDHWDIYKLITPAGDTVISDCSNMGKLSGSRGLSPCRLQANADAVTILMKTCEENKVICELQEGTALGAVKLEKVLPWERDADIAFLSANYSAFQKLQKHFEGKNFRFTDGKSQWCCVDNRTAGGIFKLAFQTWNIELYGQHMMDSETLLMEGLEPTKVLLDGHWVRVPRNPGLFVRNRYGHEVYQHAVHWMTARHKSGWEPYDTNAFPACDEPGNHDCLDRHNADGDLPFSEPMP